MTDWSIVTVLRWNTPERYYEALVQQDLFGGWELWKRWGGRGSRCGGEQIEPASSLDDALTRLQRESRRRTMRGYRPC